MYQLNSDKSMIVQKIRIGRVPTLIISPAGIQSVPVAVLRIHGGGYMLGMKEMVYASHAINMLKEYGVTVLSPGYRLSWQKPYPAAINDCYTVLEYLNDHKQEMGIERIFVGGESAGGGLCAALCMMARDRGIHISFQMPLYPMINNFDTPSSKDNHGKVWNTRKNHLGWKLYLRKEANSNVSPYASPSRQNDYHHLPPCYTFVGDGEPFYYETMKYVEDLKNAGVDALIDVYHSDVHSFDMLRPEEDIAKIAKQKLMEHFVYALENYQ